MTYWNEIADSHLQYWNSRESLSYFRLRSEISEEGYRSDKLQPSKVVYVGTCDVMSCLNKEYTWVNMVHNRLHSDQPLIALGTLSSGLSSMIRRLYAYIQNFGAPEVVYLTIPRFDSYEFVNKTGKCYSVSSRIGTADFCRSVNMIDDADHIIWLKQLDDTRELANKNNNRYIVEERFAFLETLCKAYDIRLKWTFNPSDAGIKILYENLEVFRDISDMMQRSFVGMPVVRDHLPNRTIGPETHNEIYLKFINNEHWDFNELSRIAISNFNWVSERYQKNIIVSENQ